MVKVLPQNSVTIYLANSNVMSLQSAYLEAYLLTPSRIMIAFDMNLRTTQNRTNLPVFKFRYKNKDFLRIAPNNIMGKINDQKSFCTLWVVDGWYLCPLTWEANYLLSPMGVIFGPNE